MAGVALGFFFGSYDCQLDHRSRYLRVYFAAHWADRIPHFPQMLEEDYL